MVFSPLCKLRNMPSFGNHETSIKLGVNFRACLERFMMDINFSLFGEVLVVRVPGYRSRGPSSIQGATRFSEK
jgi:hypothetical protein